MVFFPNKALALRTPCAFLLVNIQCKRVQFLENLGFTQYGPAFWTVSYRFHSTKLHQMQCPFPLLKSWRAIFPLFSNNSQRCLMHWPLAYILDSAILRLICLTFIQGWSWSASRIPLSIFWNCLGVWYAWLLILSPSRCSSMFSCPFSPLYIHSTLRAC